jgi:SAM-dependent methyltransferase
VTGLSADPARAEPTGERFIPDLMGGHLVEAEHMVRYLWAAQFAPGRRTLDAGSGMGYGSRTLAEGGADGVVGVDRDAAVVELVRGEPPAGVSFEVGDLLSLPFGADEFDYVVCFEAIEHVEDPQTVLDELRRVLRPDGLLAISTPNRDVYMPGNPFHLRELTPNELEAELGRRFGTVTLRRQHTWIASAVLDDDSFRTGGNAAISDVEVRKAWGEEPGRETYTVALAGAGELPSGRGLASLTADVDIRDWSERLERAAQAQAAAAAEASAEHAAEREFLRRETAGLRTQLTAAETELARLTEVEAQLAGVAPALAEHEAVVNSLSWRLTKPLRSLMARLHR